MKPSQAPALFAGNLIVVGAPIGPETMDALAKARATGATLWDYYAAHAPIDGETLDAVLEVKSNKIHLTPDAITREAMQALAISAGYYADAMLAERARREKEAE